MAKHRRDIIGKRCEKVSTMEKNKNDEYELLNSDYLDDASSADINLKSKTNSNYKVYFDSETLKIGVKHWITDFYSCQKIESSNFAKKKN